ncbi:hypothetical protein [Pseudonocardia sp. TRM90224]|uniref:hypothetical protein n=1 Tax=Pseudonocardia sp. TRM90224 TaxID=2812678 RepID=UPI001E33DAB1|nr:hypothetical protein [Pseudonocardia sp. TRM90224]
MGDTGSHEFDFIFGQFHVHHRKLRDNTDPACTEWVEFEGGSKAFPVLGELGHVHILDAPAPPDGEPFEGLTLRLYDPATGTWGIWWSSTRAPGRLDPPMTGRFTGRHGVFHGSDVIGGNPVDLRFEWHADPENPRWEQSFSWDGGQSWRLNWVMSFSRR